MDMISDGKFPLQIAHCRPVRLKTESDALIVNLILKTAPVWPVASLATTWIAARI
jgi:hypothetical protein